MKGDFMSRSTNTITNKQQKHPKVHFQQYLYNASEPEDNFSNDLPPELGAELLEASYFMKRRVRRIAEKLRTHYS